jgi:hypothetical protein
MSKGRLKHLTRDERKEFSKMAHAAKRAMAGIKPRFNIWRGVRLDCLRCKHSYVKVRRCDDLRCPL